MADKFVVKKLTHEYVDDVLFIEKELLGSGLKEDIEKTISSDVLDYYLLFLNEKVIGFFEVSNVAGESELFDIAIKKEFKSAPQPWRKIIYFFDKPTCKNFIKQTFLI